MPVITESALEGAAGVGQGLGTFADDAEGTGNDAITAAVANVVLHKDGTDLGAHDRAGRAGFEATGVFAMFADVGQEDPAKWILRGRLA